MSIKNFSSRSAPSNISCGANRILLSIAATWAALSLMAGCPVQAQSPGGNLGALLARLKADETNIASLQSTVQAQQNTINQMASNGVAPIGPAGGDLIGSFPNPAIAANAVTSDKLAAGAVTSDKIAANAITTATLADGSVTAGKIAPGAINLNGPAGGDLIGNYPNPVIAANAIGYTKLAVDQASLGQVSGGNMSVQNSGDIAINYDKYFCVSAFDTFSYQGLNLGNYSLGWFGDPDFASSGPTAWLSGYGGIKLFTNCFPRLTIAPGGNVGIGTTSPEATLDVIGDLHTSAESHFALGVYTDPANGIPAALKVSSGLAADTIIAHSLQITGGSDLAEPYKIASSAQTTLLPGMVVAIDPQKSGQMRICTHAYDTGVAGIISGANGVKPGVIMRQAGTVADGTMPIASVGRVWCYCDADAGGPIAASDLLTTSDTPGYAMRVGDYNKAKGAILGKAMSPLKSGKGLVLVLVTLQ